MLPVLLLSVLLAGRSQAKPHWKYGSEDTWEVCKGGRHVKSPVGIVPSTAKTFSDKFEIEFNWESRNTGLDVYVENTGNTVIFHAPNMMANVVLQTQEGGDFNGSYTLDHSIFHWGKSEHSINEKTYSGEIEMVHFKTALGTYANSYGKNYGILVFSILFQEDPLLSSDQEKAGIEAFKSTLKHVKNPGTKHSTDLNDLKMSFENLLPEIKELFIYVGTLTAPPCQAGIGRVVFKHPIKVTSDFMSELRSVNDVSKGAMNNNFKAANKYTGPLFKFIP